MNRNNTNKTKRLRYQTDPEFREKIQATNKRWRDKNKQYFRDYYAKHPDVQRKASAKWNKKFPERSRNYSAAYYVEHKELINLKHAVRHYERKLQIVNQRLNQLYFQK